MILTTRNKIAKRYDLTKRQCENRFRSNGPWKDHPLPVKKVHNEAYYDKEASDLFLEDWERLQGIKETWGQRKKEPFVFSGDALLILQFLQPGIRYRQVR